MKAVTASVIVRRVVLAVSTLPGREDWPRAAALLFLLGLVALPVGLGTGFLRIEVVGSWEIVVRTLLTAALFPALAEELLFRVLLVPHPEEEAPARARWRWGGGALALFVASHPLKAWLFPAGGHTVFSDPSFLLLASLLGLACTVAYLRSGSVWLPTAIHWTAVVTWLLLLGGHGRLQA